MKVGFISLGCSKNLIDTEITIGKFKNNNFEIVNDAKKAEIIVINTCGFIESAKQEAIDTILEMSEYKKKKCKFLIVMGCLVQRYYDDLVKLLPEVDLFIKISDYDNMWNLISEKIYRKDPSPNVTFSKSSRKDPSPNVTFLPMFNEEEYLGRKLTTGSNYAYLKIGEGCSNMCTYCAIPYIRGKFKSRPMEDIIEESKKLANNGIKELIIIAQDTTKYGVDIYGKKKLAELLQEICKIDGIHWVRFLYAYPEGITNELINVVKEEEKIVKYFDIPIQHISDEVLKNMNRKTSKRNIENLIDRIKRDIPEVTLRTSLIVGFPGETEEQFMELYDFVRKTKFDKLGVFAYSKEEGTPAAKMGNQIHHMTKKKRLNKIMKLQQEISHNKMKEKIGSIQEVLIENKSNDGKVYIGRTKYDCPEVDGVIYLHGGIDLEINSFVKCKITDCREYDLIGKMSEHF